MSWGSLTFSLLQYNLQQLFGKCSGRDEKCGKMWKNVKNVLITRFLYTTNDIKAKLEELKNEFSDIFLENPQSKVKGKLAHLVLKKDAVPKFLPARTVPKTSRCRNRKNGT